MADSGLEPILSESTHLPGRARAVRSYVIREGRMTVAQSRALEELSPRYGLALNQLGDPACVFGQRGPLYLEIGIGNGENIVNTAQHNPGRHYLGCEVHRPGLGHALHRVGELALDNIRLLGADAHDVLQSLPDQSLDGVSIYFPDPWPKSRHRKRRLVQEQLLGVLHAKLKPSGALRFASDNRDYARAVVGAIERSSQWSNLAGAGALAARPKARLVTRFEARAQIAGRAVYEILAAPA